MKFFLGDTVLTIVKPAVRAEVWARPWMGSGCNGLNISKFLLFECLFSGVSQHEDLCGSEQVLLAQGTGQG